MDALASQIVALADPLLAQLAAAQALVPAEFKAWQPLGDLAAQTGLRVDEVRGNRVFDRNKKVTSAVHSSTMWRAWCLRTRWRWCFA